MTLERATKEAPRCVGCGKRPADLDEYQEMIEDWNAEIPDEKHITADDFVRMEEGTFNPEDGAFACSPCYVAMGMPSLPAGSGGGWKAKNPPVAN